MQQRPETPAQDVPATDAGQRGRTIRVVVGLGTTQIMGWGATFTPLSLMADQIGQDLHLTRANVFTGITMMLLTSALVAPRAGRLVDRTGARPLMCLGSVLLALGLFTLSIAGGIASYLLAWVIIGAATPLALNASAMAGLVQVVGPNARRPITMLTLIGGLTSTVALPVLAYLLEHYGWRGTFQVLALSHVLIGLPIHMFVLERGPPVRHSGKGSSKASWDGLLAPDMRRRALMLIALWSCMEGLITWGLYMQAIDIFKSQGMSGATAIGIWMLVGPMQATARFADLIFAGRNPITTVAIVSAVTSALSFAFIVPFGVNPTTATCFALTMGLGHGLFAIARNMLPLSLFGQREYGTYMGRLLLPQSVFNAGAPILFAIIITRLGPMAALCLAWFASFIALLSVVMLVRYCRRAAAA